MPLSEQPCETDHGPNLAAIRQLLETAYCNPIWREHVESLVGEVERLNGILEIVARADAAELRVAGETSVF